MAAAFSSLVGKEVSFVGETSLFVEDSLEEASSVVNEAVNAAVAVLKLVLDEVVDGLDESEEVVSTAVVGEAEMSLAVPSGSTSLLPVTSLNGPVLANTLCAKGSSWFSSVRSVIAIVTFMPSSNLTVFNGIAMLDIDMGVPARARISEGA